MLTAAFVPPPHILPRSRTLPRTGKKICSGCGDELPLESFRPKKRVAGVAVGHSSDCHSCHRKAVARLRKKKKTKELRRFVSASSREENLERMSALVNATVQCFGGIKKLSKAFVEEMELARKTDSPVRARCLLSLFGMLEMVEKNRPPHPSLNQISDEELSIRIVAEMWKEWPEMVVALGEVLGYEIRAPLPVEAE